LGCGSKLTRLPPSAVLGREERGMAVRLDEGEESSAGWSPGAVDGGVGWGVGGLRTMVRSVRVEEPEEVMEERERWRGVESGAPGVDCVGVM
jgi:hypothetical protein